MRILVMGLPGSGKTTLSKALVKILGYNYLNADKIRAEHNDYDFSYDGRIRQAVRMRELSKEDNFICDFVCPLDVTRQYFMADIIIWMDTISSGRYEDTNKMFEPPRNLDILIQTFDYPIDTIVEFILNKNKRKYNGTNTI